MIRCGSSKATRVASPSANVSMRSSSSRPLLPRAIGGGRGVRLHADHLDARRCTALAAMHAPAAPLPPPTGTMITSIARLVLEHLERRGRDARDQLRLVAGVDVAVAVLGRELARSGSRASSKSRPCDDDLGAERPHRRDLDGVRALRHADDRRARRTAARRTRSTGRGCPSRPRSRHARAPRPRAGRRG